MTGQDLTTGTVHNAEQTPTFGLATTTTTGDNKLIETTSLWRRFLDTVNWMPPWCRWDPGQPPAFSMAMNVVFAFAGAFTVANLYYNHPILNVLANDFDVPYEKVSQIPTLAQAGYCTGLLFVCPLGDVFRRRPFVLSLVFFAATMWMGLCLTSSLPVFSAITYISGIATVTPQLILPLVGDLAPPHRHATALSVVVSGNLLGILLARILSGVVTEYTSWRNVYWMALGLQYSVFILLWLFMPDYPSINPTGINYFKLLWSILFLYPRHPVLLYAGLVSYLTSATFTSYWTTSTFLLSGDPYNYDSVIIGLFALIGIVAMLLGPFYARFIIDRFVPVFSVIIGEMVNLVGIVIGTYTGLHTVVGPIIQAAGLDAGLQFTQIANRKAIYTVEPTRRNRVNTAFMVMTFSGQLTGTAAGNHLYARGGWIASGSLSVGLVVLALMLCVLRGPHETGWYGWGGGWGIRKKDTKISPERKVEEQVEDGGKISDEEALTEKGQSRCENAETTVAENSINTPALQGGETVGSTVDEKKDVKVQGGSST